MHLYESSIPSGNVYKVYLLLAHLGLEYTTTSLNILGQDPETRAPEFLALNKNGRVPVLVLDDGTPLAESNAILFYLAEGTRYLPDSKLGRAQVLQWLFFEQYSHEPYIAVWKACTYWFGWGDRTENEIRKLKEKGQAAIEVMEKHLEGKTFFVGEEYSIADIALFAYTSAAEAIGFEVGKNVKEWLGRVQKVEGFVKIKKDETGKCPL
ncbi:glutathione S-transferase [Corynespora cassiicola Philippines]|uniref:Glutathione S-transferase n=1 Tax=Corynespora cassiicola Philippines TaxID=1448308 RepID=A0A2T2NIA9_CORCC|nr:glutathione S-transferase [Corynespora cassiicola Philippines]